MAIGAWHTWKPSCAWEIVSVRWRRCAVADFLCTGLYGSHPLGALAALGMLRVATRLPLPQPVRLSWMVQSDWVARLHVPGAVSEDAVAQDYGCIFGDCSPLAVVLQELPH